MDKYGFVRLKIVIIGIVFILSAISGYRTIPDLISSQINTFTGGTTSSVQSGILSQMGIPPLDTIIQFTQYCLIGLIVAGLGTIVFGMMVKKTPKQVYKNIKVEDIQEYQKSAPTPDKTILQLLHERLVKGEITSSQYQNLKNILEEKTD